MGRGASPSAPAFFLKVKKVIVLVITPKVTASGTPELNTVCSPVPIESTVRVWDPLPASSQPLMAAWMTRFAAARSATPS